MSRDRPIPRQPARSYMLWLLSRRDYSALQLRERLRLRGYEEADVEAAIALAQSYNYQSDTRYAQGRVRSDAPRMGDRRLRAQLARSGIDVDVAREQLQDLAPENERVLQLLGRFEGRSLDEGLRAKVWRFLAYRGFSSSAIRAALAHLAQTAPNGEDGKHSGEK